MKRPVVVFASVSLALAVLAAAVTWVRFPDATEAGQAPDCDESYARWGGLTGRWQGMYENQTFNSSGEVTAEGFVREDCTAPAIFEGVFNQPDPQTVEASYRDESGGTVLEVTDHATFGDATITVDADGTVTIQGTGAHQGIDNYTGSGTLTLEDLHLDFTFTGSIGTATESLDLTREFTLIQGDVNCDARVDMVDFEFLLMYAAGVADGQQSAPCPDLGEPGELADYPWADVNCDDLVDAQDALFVLASRVGILLVPDDGECLGIGEFFPALT